MMDLYDLFVSIRPNQIIKHRDGHRQDKRACVASYRHDCQHHEQRSIGIATERR